MTNKIFKVLVGTVALGALIGLGTEVGVANPGGGGGRNFGGALIDRFDAVGKRFDAMAGAIKTIRPALANFYSSLTDEQKARFNTLGPPQNTKPHHG